MTATAISVGHLERRAVLGPRPPVIVDARRGDVRVTEPLLHLGDVGLVIERVGRGGRTQRMSADLEPKRGGIGPHQLVDAVRRDGAFGLSGAVVADGAEQRAVLVSAVSGGIEVLVDERVGAGMQRQIPRLAALAGDPEMRHAFPRVLGILDLQLAQFLAPQCVEQQGGQDGAVALALDGVIWRRGQQVTGLVIADRRRLAFAAFRLGPFDTLHRIMGDSVLLAEIFEQRRQRGEPVADRGAAEPASRQLVAPGDDVRPRDGAEFLRPSNAGEAHEVADRVLVDAARVGIAEIGEPLDLGRHVGQPVKFGRGQEPVGRGNRNDLGVGHAASLLLIKSVIKSKGACQSDCAVSTAQPLCQTEIPATFGLTNDRTWKGRHGCVIRSRSLSWRRSRFGHSFRSSRTLKEANGVHRREP